ncbi:MAG: FecR domain-containing protein [Betaproteobacteria bacterium]|nr:FecR domain-containing protein [Betaproteobacteria bacterium]
MFNYSIPRAAGLIAALVAALLLLPAFPAGAAAVAGTVELAEGEIRVLREARSLAPKAGDVIHVGDTVVTANDGELHLRMEDQGFLAVRPNTRMKIDAYRAEGDRSDRSVLLLFVGTLRSVTGWIGKNLPRNYSIRTPTAALGIRGTDHEPLYIPEDAPGAEGEPGTYDKVNEGETFIQNRRGKVFVKASQAAFVPFHGRAAPKLLKLVPVFFRPTRNEATIEKRRETLKQEIDKRLEERRKEIKNKKAERQKALAEKQKERRDELKKRQAERQRLQDERRLQRDEKKRELEERRKTLEEDRRQREADRDDRRERQKNLEKRRPSRAIERSEDRSESERREAAAEKRRQARERRDRNDNQEDRGRGRREP